MPQAALHRAPACHRRPAPFRSRRRPASSASCWGRRSGQKGAKPAADAAAPQPSPSRHAPLPAQRRLHPRGTSRRPGCAHRRPGAAQPSAGAAAAWPTTRSCPTSFPRPREGVLHRRRRLRRREFRARLHPHRSLSCVTRDGTAIDVPVKGYVAGEDGKAGMRGRLVSKRRGRSRQTARRRGQRHRSRGSRAPPRCRSRRWAPPAPSTPASGSKPVWAAGKTLDRLAQYYISLAEKVFPVIEVDAGRSVDVERHGGVALPGTLDAAGTDPTASRSSPSAPAPLRRNDDDED